MLMGPICRRITRTRVFCIIPVPRRFRVRRFIRIAPCLPVRVFMIIILILWVVDRSFFFFFFFPPLLSFCTPYDKSVIHTCKSVICIGGRARFNSIHPLLLIFFFFFSFLFFNLQIMNLSIHFYFLHVHSTRYRNDGSIILPFSLIDTYIQDDRHAFFSPLAIDIKYGSYSFTS